MSPTTFTIGHGARSLRGFTQALTEREVSWVLDVRSVPVATYHTHYSRDPLEAHLRAQKLGYVWVGHLLGGKGDDGADSAEVFATRTKVRRGLDRVATAVSKGLTVCLMCGEGRPHTCHRARLIGPALLTYGITLQHILPDDRELDQHALMAATRGDQLGLF